jgi:hypothetical protein
MVCVMKLTLVLLLLLLMVMMMRMCIDIALTWHRFGLQGLSFPPVTDLRRQKGQHSPT